MANIVLTPRMILREVYAIAHQESNFIMRVNRQYDNRYARTGAKNGQTLDVRLPAKYVTRRGNVMQTQNYVERSVPLILATIDGIDLNFGQEELTFSMEDFSTRVLRPAVSQLVATVESTTLKALYPSVANFAGAVNAAVTYKSFQQTGQYMTEQLAPKGMDRNICFQPQAAVDFNDAVKGLFQSSDNIKEQYIEGLMGRTGGFNCYENTLVPAHTPGLLGGTPLVAGANQGSDGAGNAWATFTDLATDGWTASTAILKAGDILTIAGVLDVQPESKDSYGRLKRFVVQQDVTSTGGGLATVRVSPAIISGGAYQNVTLRPADNAPITVLDHDVGDTSYGQSLAFHKNAFAFVTADLEDPSQYGAWGAREVMENLSFRIWRQGDIINGQFPCRLDIAYGSAPIYPEWAARLVYKLA